MSELITSCYWSPSTGTSSSYSSAMASKIGPALKPFLRAQQTSFPANGHGAFVPQARKLVFEFCDNWASSTNLRTFIHNRLEDLARQNPHVEFVVRRRSHREPVIRGFYSTSFATFAMLLSNTRHSQSTTGTKSLA